MQKTMTNREADLLDRREYVEELLSDAQREVEAWAHDPGFQVSEDYRNMKSNVARLEARIVALDQELRALRE